MKWAHNQKSVAILYYDTIWSYYEKLQIIKSQECQAK